MKDPLAQLNRRQILAPIECTFPDDDETIERNAKLSKPQPWKASPPIFWTPFGITSSLSSSHAANAQPSILDMLVGKRLVPKTNTPNAWYRSIRNPSQSSTIPNEVHPSNASSAISVTVGGMTMPNDAQHRNALCPILVALPRSASLLISCSDQRHLVGSRQRSLPP